MATDQVPIQRSQVSLKTITTVVFTVLAILAGLYVVVHARVAIGITVVASLLAGALHHAVDFLTRRGWKRNLAIVAVLLITSMAAVGIALLLLPPAVSQGRALANQLPELTEKARHLPIYERLDARFDLSARFQQLREHAPAYLQRAVEPMLAFVQNVLKLFAAALAVYGMVIFMLFFGERLVKGLLDEAVQPRRQLYERVLRKIYDAVGGYLGGLGLICLSNATCTTIFLAILGQPFFLPLGILSGLSSLIPLVGNIIVGALIALIALATGGLWQGVACAIFFILYQQFENHVISPLVYRQTVNMNPLVTVIALLVFAELAGVPGALIAVPVVAVAQILLREILLYRRQRLHLPPEGPANPSAPPGGHVPQPAREAKDVTAPR